MKTTAKISKEWRERMTIILVLLAGSAGWFFYDGLVSYPKFNVKADAYAELVEIYKADEAQLEDEWKKLALERGWEVDEVPKKRKNEAQQFKWGTGIAIFAAIFLLWMLREMTRKIVFDEEKFDGISILFPLISKIVPVEFSAVIGIDKRKWDKKGIAKIFYKTSAGTRNSVLVDDYKYAGSEEILFRCEKILEAKKAAKIGVPAEENSAKE